MPVIGKEYEKNVTVNKKIKFCLKRGSIDNYIHNIYVSKTNRYYIYRNVQKLMSWMQPDERLIMMNYLK